MRFVTFLNGDAEALGVRAGDDVIDVTALHPDAPRSMAALIASGRDGLAMIAAAIASAPSSARQPFSAARLLAPLTRPGKIVCVGLNYADHRAEAGESTSERPAFPGMFHKLASSVVGPGAPILVPAVSEQLDFEGELAVIIGKRAHRVAVADALDHVFGYTILDDGSVRDFQVQKAVAAGKNFDCSGAMGPQIVTVEDLPPGASGLKLETRLNGAVMQSSNTGLLIFNVAEIISMLSEIHALEPGDVIATGTCAGVGGGRTPPIWMKAGDVLEIEIEGIGVLRNPVASARQ